MKIKLIILIIFFTPFNLLGDILDCSNKENCTDYENFQYIDLICYNVCKVAGEKNLQSNNDFMSCEVNFINSAKESSILTRIEMKDLKSTSDIMYESLSKIKDNELLNSYEKCLFRMNLSK